MHVRQSPPNEDLKLSLSPKLSPRFYSHFSFSSLSLFPFAVAFDHYAEVSGQYSKTNDWYRTKTFDGMKEVSDPNQPHGCMYNQKYNYAYGRDGIDTIFWNEVDPADYNPPEFWLTQNVMSDPKNPAWLHRRWSSLVWWWGGMCVTNGSIPLY